MHPSSYYLSWLWLLLYSFPDLVIWWKVWAATVQTLRKLYRLLEIGPYPFLIHTFIYDISQAKYIFMITTNFSIFIRPLTLDLVNLSRFANSSTDKNNPTYGRRWLSQRVRIIALCQKNNQKMLVRFWSPLSFKGSMEGQSGTERGDNPCIQSGIPPRFKGSMRWRCGTECGDDLT